MKQYKRLIKRVSALCVASSIIMSMNTTYVSAASMIGEIPLAGITPMINDYNLAIDMISAYEIGIASLDTNADIKNFAVANVTNYLNVRKEPGENKAIIGKLPKDGSCTIVDTTDNGWVKIKSGKVTGYVKDEFLIRGNDAIAKAKKVGSIVATIDTDALNVRETASLFGEIITSVPNGESYEVVELTAEWVKISIDQDTGYIARQYVELSYELEKAVLVSDNAIAGVSTSRNNLVSFAKKWLGGKYVWGGTKLGVGVDCSGFTQQVYKNFGISLPRTSGEQARGGRAVTSSTVQPGDLVFYGSGGRINHVAIYIGNGQVIHASTARTGIKISNMNYRTPSKYVSYMK